MIQRIALTESNGSFYGMDFNSLKKNHKHAKSIAELTTSDSQSL